MTVTHISVPIRQEKLCFTGKVNAKRGPQHGMEFRTMARKKRFVAYCFALLLTGFLVALDFALAAKTVDQLARSEIHAGIRPASSVR